MAWSITHTGVTSGPAASIEVSGRNIDLAEPFVKRRIVHQSPLPLASPSETIANPAREFMYNVRTRARERASTSRVSFRCDGGRPSHRIGGERERDPPIEMHFRESARIYGYRKDACY